MPLTVIPILTFAVESIWIIFGLLPNDVPDPAELFVSQVASVNDAPTMSFASGTRPEATHHVLNVPRS